MATNKGPTPPYLPAVRLVQQVVGLGQLGGHAACVRALRHSGRHVRCGAGVCAQNGARLGRSRVPSPSGGSSQRRWDLPSGQAGRQAWPHATCLGQSHGLRLPAHPPAMSRSAVTVGTRAPAAASSSGVRRASAFAASRNMSSLTRVLRLIIRPSARPAECKGDVRNRHMQQALRQRGCQGRPRRLKGTGPSRARALRLVGRPQRKRRRRQHQWNQAAAAAVAAPKAASEAATARERTGEHVGCVDGAQRAVLPVRQRHATGGEPVPKLGAALRPRQRVRRRHLAGLCLPRGRQAGQREDEGPLGACRGGGGGGGIGTQVERSVCTAHGPRWRRLASTHDAGHDTGCDTRGGLPTTCRRRLCKLHPRACTPWPALPAASASHTSRSNA